MWHIKPFKPILRKKKAIGEYRGNFSLEGRSRTDSLIEKAN